MFGRCFCAVSCVQKFRVVPAYADVAVGQQVATPTVVAPSAPQLQAQAARLLLGLNRRLPPQSVCSQPARQGPTPIGSCTMLNRGRTSQASQSVAICVQSCPESKLCGHVPPPTEWLSRRVLIVMSLESFSKGQLKGNMDRESHPN